MRRDPNLALVAESVRRARIDAGSAAEQSLGAPGTSQHQVAGANASSGAWTAFGLLDVTPLSAFALAGAAVVGPGALDGSGVWRPFGLLGVTTLAEFRLAPATYGQLGVTPLSEFRVS